MNVEIKFGSHIENFEDKQSIIIGTAPDCDFVIEGVDEIINIKSLANLDFKGKYINM